MKVREYYTEESIKGFPSDRTQNNKVRQLLELLNDPEVQTFLKNFVENAIATSELRILKRIAKIEQIVGLDDYDLDENSAPTLPQRIESIEEKVNNSIASFKPPSELDIKPTTKIEERAVVLVEHARKSRKGYLTHPEIMSILKNKLPDSCKLEKNIQNIRKVKQDALKKAKRMYSDVFLDPNEHGHHEVRLVMGVPS